MLSNRVFRLITSVLVFLGIGILIVAIINPIFESNKAADVVNNGIMFSLMICTGVCLIHQICWDLLNFSFLENIVGRIIKRILFIAIFLMAILMGCMGYFDSTLNQSIYSAQFANAGVIVQAIAISPVVAPMASAILCLLSDRLCWEREYVPFYSLYSIGISIGVGLIVALLGESMWVVAPIILLVGGLAFIVIFCIKKRSFIYGEEEYEYSSGYSGGYSGGSSGYSGYDEEERDNRKSDGIFLNEFELSMHRIANSHSRSTSLSHGAYLSCNVYSSTYPGGVDFQVRATVTVYTEYLSHQADVYDIQSDAKREVEDIMYSIKSDAESSISSLRDEFTDYDGTMHISVNPEISFDQR